MSLFIASLAFPKDSAAGGGLSVVACYRAGHVYYNAGTLAVPSRCGELFNYFAGRRRRTMRNKAKAVLLGLGLASGSAYGGCGLDVDPGKLDKDWNGELSRGEVRGTVLDDVFERVDTNNDGVIGQPEFASRCTALRQSEESPVADAVKEKAERQQQRQQNRVESRIDRETDRAVDRAIDRGLNRLFR